MKLKLLVTSLFVMLSAGLASAQLADTIMIKGTVKDSTTNLAINLAKVKLLFTFGMGNPTVLDSAFTDVNGAYVIPQAPISRFGSTSVQTSKAGYTTQASSVSGSLPDTLTKDFLLVSNGAVDETTRVSGAVTDSVTGDSLANAYVAIYTITIGGGGDVTIDTLGYTLTGAEGTYLIKLVTDMTSVTVSSYASGYYTQTERNVPLQATTTLNIRLAPNLGVGKLLTGVVTDTATTLPLQNAVVLAYNTMRAFLQEDSTDAQGRYNIAGIPADINNLTVTVSRAGYTTKNLGQVSVGTDTTTLDIQLKAVVSISARYAVLAADASGLIVKVSPQPTAGPLTFTGNASGTVKLTVLSVDGTPVFSGSQTAHDGGFTFTWHVDSRLPAGAYVYRLTIGDVTEAGALILQK